MKSLLLSQLIILHPIVYPVIFVAMMIEGDIFIFTSFFLIFLGILNGPITFAVIYAGAIIGDLLWYHSGHTYEGRNRFSRWLFGIVSKMTTRFDNHILERTPHVLFISKFTYGLHHLILLRAGALHVDFKKIIKIDLVTTLIWIFIVGGLGFISGASFTLIKHKLEYLEIGILVAIVIFFIVGETISRILRKKI